MSQSGIAKSPSPKTERAIAGIDSKLVAGVDEAGRGPWAGPVVAAAVIFRQKRIPKGLDDSKRLPADFRSRLFDEIHDTAWVGVGAVSVEDIDRLNILQASLLAMSQAVSKLCQLPDVVLVDGNRCPDLSPRAVPVINGDQLCPSIAAASIIAKVTRDRLMEKLSNDFPDYGWHSNKGYGTRAHSEAIKTFGVTHHHRRSFAPIRLALSNAAVADSTSL